ncbi:MAG TPA: RNA polymerase sigma factor [Polyangiaceae bacterium]|nr:RNA polymerase sigma factor [Polyangiaceae bacterium]
MIAAIEAVYVVPKRPQLRLVDGASPEALSETGAPVPQNFDDLFRRFAPYVGAIALKILGRDDEVDDLVQEVFIKAHRGLSNLKDPQAVRPWLATITVRMARRRLRLYWFSRVFRLNELGDGLVDTQASPEQRALVSSVYRWLERMPANERIVWVLRQVEGQTLEQIAEICECSLSTVQRRLRAAREFMDKVVSRERAFPGQGGADV